jgi:TonB-linked SusC/RagA family outer membrane protein
VHAALPDAALVVCGSPCGCLQPSSRSAAMMPILVDARLLSSTRRRVMRRAVPFALAVLTVPWLPARAQQPPGTITGRVTDAENRAPIAGVNVLVAGTQLGVQSSDSGTFILRGVQPGNVELAVTRIGYEARRVAVQVTSGETVTANVQLTHAPYSLAAVVTTATGQQRKVEVSNAIATVSVADQIAQAPITDVSGLLSGRASGVQVVAGGATGSGSRIRIRGQSSLSLNNEPLIYIDGVRVTGTSGSSAIGVGGSAPSRINDINPEEIESIEVIKGPSAATLFGTEAANGVISITTKRGRSGRTLWNLYTENGVITDPNTYPSLYHLWGTQLSNNAVRRCNVSEVAVNVCRADSVATFNLFERDQSTPIDQGRRQQYGLQTSGGTDRVQFFISGEYEQERGVYKMPQFEINRLKTERGVTSLPDEQVYPNALERVNLRSNLSAQISNSADIQASVGYVTSDQRLPQNEDNSTGLMVGMMGGPGRLDRVDARSVPLLGQFAYQMGDVFSRTTTQDVDRFINSLSSRWAPKSWLTTRAVAGIDWASREDEAINLFDQGPYFFPQRSGNIRNDRTALGQYTFDVSAGATFNPFSSIQSKTTAGFQYFRNYSSRTSGTGETLPPGGTTTTVAAVRASTQASDETVTLGYFIEEALSFRDRIFLTAAIRLDDNSAFGRDFDAVKYPKFGLSWLMSEEGWFPDLSWVTQLRLRSTYGASGAAPGTTDALRFLDGIGNTLTGQVEVPGVTLGALGNAQLKPEYSGEVEGGFDLTMLSGRANVELTYYNKKTRDALISRRVAPSLAGVTSRFENIGSVRNSGFEGTLNMRLVDRNMVGFELTLTGSTNKNELIKLGEGVSPIATGNRNSQLNTPGYPLYGLWGRDIIYDDANNDGMLAVAEAKLGDFRYIGPSFPTREIAVSPSLDLFKRKLRIQAQVDHKGGMQKLYNTRRHMCDGGNSCEGLNDPDAPLDFQAAALGIKGIGGVTTLRGFYYDGAFTRLREASVSYELPMSWAQRVRASRVNLIATGRNLGVWTNYPGIDPEATVGNTDTRGNEEFFSTPPMRYFTLRANLSF